MVQNPNFPLTAWQAAFGSAPNSATRGTWYDLAARTTGWSCQAGRQYELGQIQAGIAGLAASNLDEALTPANVASPYYAATPAARQWGSVSSGSSSVTAITTDMGTPTAGSMLLMVACANNFAVTAPSGWTPVLPASVSTAAQKTYAWWKVADGTEHFVTLTAAAAGVMAMAWVEYTGLQFVIPVDVTATASRTASSSTIQATGTTAATTEPVELVVYVACPHGFAAASPPTAASWTVGTARNSSATSSATSASNCAVIIADRVTSAAGTQTSTATWTNASTDAAGMVIAFRAQPQLVPWRPIRCWAAWPHTGNILNAANTAWDASVVDSSTFEGGTVGAWLGFGGATVANSGTRAHDGTKSMLVTWPTASAGAAFGYLTAARRPPTKVGATYTASAWVWVPAGHPAVRLTLSTTQGAASSTTAAWGRISVTWTAADGAGTGTLYLAAAGASTAGQQVWVDSIQVEVAANPTTFTTGGPAVHPVHTGFIERYPGTWTANGFYGWSSLTAVDALAVLPKVTLDDCLTADIQQDHPVAAFALDDPAGAVSARAYAASGFGSGVSTVSIGVSATPPAFGTTGGPGVDGATCVALTPTNNTNLWGLMVGVPADAYTGDTGSGVSMEIWFKTSTHAADQCVIVAVGYGLYAWEIRVSTAGLVYAQITDDAGSTFEYTITGPPCADGGWHHVVVTESAAGGTITGTLYVDGVSYGTDTRAGSAGFGARGWWLGSQWWPYFAQPLTGSVARLGWYRTALTAARVQSHYLASRGFPYDTTSTRMARVLAWMPWAGPTVIPATTTDVGPAAGYAGRTLTDIMQGLAVTEGGIIMAGPSGEIEMIPRQAYYRQTSAAWTFGEDTTAGEYPYEADFATDQDPTYLANQVTVTRDGGTAQLAKNPASQGLYFPASLPVSTVHTTDVWALSLARYLMWRYASPRTRTAQVTFKPAANTTLWPMVLGARVGDRVRVKRRTSAGWTYTFDGFIESISHTVDPTSEDYWTTAMQVSPADPAQAGLIGDATYGLIGSTAIVVY